MRANWILTAAVVAMSVTAAVDAQSAKAMGKPSKSDTMSTTAGHPRTIKTLKEIAQSCS